MVQHVSNMDPLRSWRKDKTRKTKLVKKLNLENITNV